MGEWSGRPRAWTSVLRSAGLLIARGGVARGEEARCRGDVDFGDEDALLTIRQIALALAGRCDERGRRLGVRHGVVHTGEVDRVLEAAAEHRLFIIRRGARTEGGELGRACTLAASQ